MFCFLILRPPPRSPFFFFNDTATTEIYTLSLHDALPISRNAAVLGEILKKTPRWQPRGRDTQSFRPLVQEEKRSKEHTSELQSLAYLVCRLLLEKKKKTKHDVNIE